MLMLGGGIGTVKLGQNRQNIISLIWPSQKLPIQHSGFQRLDPGPLQTIVQTYSNDKFTFIFSWNWGRHGRTGHHRARRLAHPTKSRAQTSSPAYRSKTAPGPGAPLHILFHTEEPAPKTLPSNCWVETIWIFDSFHNFGQLRGVGYIHTFSCRGHQWN